MKSIDKLKYFGYNNFIQVSNAQQNYEGCEKGDIQMNREKMINKTIKIAVTLAALHTHTHTQLVY